MYCLEEAIDHSNQHNRCIHIHANGDRSEIIIEPEDLQLLLMWKAEKQKQHDSNPNLATNKTERGILNDWKASKVELKRSDTKLRQVLFVYKKK